MIAKDAAADSTSRTPNRLALSLLGQEETSAAPDASPFPGSGGQKENRPLNRAAGKRTRPQSRARSLSAMDRAQTPILEVAATVEQLSTAEELHASSQQISSAVAQIMKAAGIQAKGTDPCAALGEHLRHIARRADNHPGLSGEGAAAAKELLGSNTMSVNALIECIGAHAHTSGQAARNLQQLKDRRRRIDKILDAIAEVTVPNEVQENGKADAGRIR